MENDKNGRWHNRGYLPHFEAGAVPQFITFRLADSLPRSLFKRLKFQLNAGMISDSEYAYTLDKYLDRSRGNCALSRTGIAGIVRDSILFLGKKKYRLHSWVIMPNHVHLLLSPAEGESLSRIMHSLKSFSGHRANQELGRSGPFWSKEYYDRMIRDAEHFLKTKRYIEMNPVKARLCETPEEWEFSSAFAEA